LDTLNNALNIPNRPRKVFRFGFQTSEDALTWTVFTYLARTGQLGEVFHALGVLKVIAPSATLLLWGEPFPLESERGRSIRRLLITICDHLGENSQSRSEPDVILDFGPAGLVVIEVKYLSENDKKPYGSRYDKYVQGTDCFRDAESIGRSELYELTRNWRIGCQLAEGRPFTLVNLITGSKEPSCSRVFREGLNTTPTRQFLTRSWPQLTSATSMTEWILKYLRGHPKTLAVDQLT